MAARGQHMPVPQMVDFIQDQPGPSGKRCKVNKAALLKYAKQLLKQSLDVLVQLETTTTPGKDEEEPNSDYFITNGNQEQVLSATVESVFCIRVGFGQLVHPRLGMKTLYPISGAYDVMHLFRQLRCCFWFCPLSLQSLEIFAPPDQYFALVEQTFNMLNAVFEVKDAMHNVLLYVVGQNMKMDMFKILNHIHDEVGTIRLETSEHMENRVLQRKEAFNIYFQGDDDQQLMVLGTTLLIDRMYWETPKYFRKHKI